MISKSQFVIFSALLAYQGMVEGMFEGAVSKKSDGMFENVVNHFSTIKSADSDRKNQSKIEAESTAKSASEALNKARAAALETRGKDANVVEAERKAAVAALEAELAAESELRRSDEDAKVAEALAKNAKAVAEYTFAEESLKLLKAKLTKLTEEQKVLTAKAVEKEKVKAEALAKHTAAAAAVNASNPAGGVINPNNVDVVAKLAKETAALKESLNFRIAAEKEATEAAAAVDKGTAEIAKTTNAIGEAEKEVAALKPAADQAKKDMDATGKLTRWTERVQASQKAGKEAATKAAEEAATKAAEEAAKKAAEEAANKNTESPETSPVADPKTEENPQVPSVAAAEAAPAVSMPKFTAMKSEDIKKDVEELVKKVADSDKKEATKFLTETFGYFGRGEQLQKNLDKILKERDELAKKADEKAKKNTEKDAKKDGKSKSKRRLGGEEAAPAAETVVDPLIDVIEVNTREALVSLAQLQKTHGDKFQTVTKDNYAAFRADAKKTGEAISKAEAVIKLREDNTAKAADLKKAKATVLGLGLGLGLGIPVLVAVVFTVLVKTNRVLLNFGSSATVSADV